MSGDRTAGRGIAMAAVPRAPAAVEDARAISDAMNDFGFELLRASVPGDGNGVLSPASVALALAMARAGAGGETAREIDAATGGLAADDHAAALNALDQALAQRSGAFVDADGDEAPVRLRVANAPFAQDGLGLEPAYLDALASRFGAGLRLVDFRADPEAARRAINAWVGDATEGRIEELLGGGTVDPMTRLVLVNAIYLKAAWQRAFLPEGTTDAAFTRLDGSTALVPTMHGQRTVPHAAGAGWRAIELPYVGGSLAMTLVVPDDLPAFVADLRAERFAEIVAAMRVGTVDLALPKFGLETRVELGPALEGLGIRAAFDPDAADFSGIATSDRLWISAVVHQANLDLDEAGTEAAAATAVVMRVTGMPVENLRFPVDRPFLFALRDTATGAIVFLGQVTEPRVRPRSTG